MENFTQLGLPAELLKSLESMKFSSPTPIQAQTIPFALNGDDVLGAAQTGTGKTGAYGIPLVSHLLTNPLGCALVLLPTRELATQVLDTLKQILGHRSNIRTALLIGGDSMYKQLRQLDSGPRLVVGTPGRINDHLSRGSLTLGCATFFVLDETDRMLDMGFSIQIQHITKELPKDHQTLMFSATMSPTIMKTAQSYLNNPKQVTVGSTTTPIDKIKQEIMKVADAQKYGILMDKFESIEGTFVVFVKTKFSAERLAQKLCFDGINAGAIHGDLRQKMRDRVIADFRDGHVRVLVATDIAARGLDIPHIACVINYDLPQCPEDYIHRIGRTGRNGAEGTAISLVTSADSSKWRLICKMMNPNDHSAQSEPRGRRGEFQKRRGQGGYGGAGGGAGAAARRSAGRSEGGRFEGGRSEGNRFEGGRSEGRRFEGRSESRFGAPKAAGAGDRFSSSNKPRRSRDRLDS